MFLMPGTYVVFSWAFDVAVRSVTAFEVNSQGEERGFALNLYNAATGTISFQVPTPLDGRNLVKVFFQMSWARAFMEAGDVSGEIALFQIGA